MSSLRTAFIGGETPFTVALCRWLAERTDLRLIVWTSRTSWPHRPNSPVARIGGRILRAALRKGVWRSLDEAAYYCLYLLFLHPHEEFRIRQLTESLNASLLGHIDDIPQVRPAQIRDPDFLLLLTALHLDTIFATCT